MSAKSGLKANKPTEFTGSYTKSEEFLQECEVYIRLSDPSAADGAKIAFILTYLKGAAPSAWKRQYCASGKDATDSYAVFKTKFVEAFGDPNKASNALTRLERLNQGKQSLEQYIATFLILQAEANLTEEGYLIRRLVSGLNERLRDKMITNGKATWTMQEHINQLREWESSHNVYKGFTPFRHSPALSPGVPMDVDKKKSTSIRTQNLPKLTPEERQRCFKEKLCYRCRQPGHSASNCTGQTIVTTSTKTTGKDKKGKARKEVVEESKEEETVSDEEEVIAPKKKKVKKAKTSSKASSSCHPPQSPPSSDADNEDDPPSYQAARASIVRSLAHFPPEQRHRLAESISEESF